MMEALERFELIMRLRRRGVRDTRVLRAVEGTPRELFVDQAFIDQAWLDMALPIGFGQTIGSPFMVAYMTEKLAPTEASVALEIGTGSGYQTAVIARLCRHVHTIERHPILAHLARQRFAELGLDNVTAIAGDGWLGWPGGGEFDRIIVNAAAPALPRHLIDILRPGGRLIAPVGADPDAQRVVEAVREEGGVRVRKLAPSRFALIVRGRVKA